MKRKLTCTNYFIILEKKIFKRAHQNPNANVRACPDVTFWAVGYHYPPPPRPESQLAFHIYYVKYETQLHAKGLVGTRGGMMF